MTPHDECENYTVQQCMEIELQSLEFFNFASFLHLLIESSELNSIATETFMDNSHSFTTNSNHLTGENRHDMNESASSNEGSRIGWAFIGQYYSYLNKEPHKLHCFYTKQSTFVHSTEGAEAIPCYGQKEIHNKILSLDLQDCKVYISSVDCQTSAQGGIIVQVLGELSNKGKKWKKFVQTFFLAEQNAGYFVLNDIRRFIKEEDDEDEEEEEVVVEQSLPKVEMQEKIEMIKSVAEVVMEEKPIEVIKVVEPVTPILVEPIVEVPVVVEPIIIEKPIVVPEIIAPIVEEVISVPVVVPVIPNPTPEPTPVTKPTPKQKSTPKPKEEKLEKVEIIEKVEKPIEKPIEKPVVPTPVVTEAPPKPTLPIPSTPAAVPAKSWADLTSQSTKSKSATSAISSKAGISSTVSSTPTSVIPTSTNIPTGPTPSFVPTKSTPFPPSIASLNSSACFIKGISESFTTAMDKQLKDYLLKNFGPLKDFDLLKSKNCGFCEFESVTGAKKAILQSLKKEEGGGGGFSIAGEWVYVVTKVSGKGGRGGGGGQRNGNNNNNNNNSNNSNGVGRKDESKEGGNKEGKKSNNRVGGGGPNGNGAGNAGNGNSNSGNRPKKVASTPAPAK